MISSFTALQYIYIYIYTYMCVCVRVCVFCVASRWTIIDIDQRCTEP